VKRSITAVLFGTFTLRFSTGLTGALLIYYLADLEHHGGSHVQPIELGFMQAAFFASELCLSPFFGVLSDRLGHHRIMQLGPVFGIVAAVLTGITANLWLIGSTRILEGASTAASVPSILGFLAFATANDQVLRGKTSSRFELATLAGIGGGIAAAGPIWQAIGPGGFFANALIYVGSLLIYRYQVDAPDTPVVRSGPPLSRYLGLLTRSHVWLLAPTWIAINAAIGLYTSQTLFQLVNKPDPGVADRFADQLLVGKLDPLQVTAGLLIAGAIFFGGLVYWGNRFRDLRRTTIIFAGIVGGAVLVAGALAFNHSDDWSLLLKAPPALAVAAGLFVMAGATPAALGLLADISEAFPDDRGAIMGLYSVFLGIGQIIGSLVGGAAADRWALDGIFLATLVLLATALVPLAALRRYEFRFEESPQGGPRQAGGMP
jgi:MFS family permease